jgi:predicted ester cyclase
MNLSISRQAENRAVVMRLIEDGFNGRNLAVVRQLLAPEYVHHAGGGRQVTRDLYLLRLEELLAALPDYQVAVEQLAAGDADVAVRCRCTGTQRGGLAGRPASGRELEWTASIVYRVTDGLIRAGREDLDALAVAAALAAA